MTSTKVKAPLLVRATKGNPLTVKTGIRAGAQEMKRKGG